MCSVTSNTYFTIVSLEDGLTVKLSQNASEYSIDGGEWTRLNANVATPSVNTGHKIQFKIDNPTITNINGIGTFTVNKTFNIEGNIMSLLLGDLFKEQIDISRQNYVFYKLFFNCRTLQNAENLILPATILPNGCYQYMFSGCTALITPPSLPAITLSNSCYYSMFSGCTALKIAPLLPARTLANNCYDCMFVNCVSLEAAPELPATTLADNCYSNMFYNCTSLVATPIELPAEILKPYCYDSMFSCCSSLRTAPELPAPRLTECCYMYMFEGCENLNRIKMLAVDVRAVDCLSEWVNGVAIEGTFIKSANINLPRGTNGIPEEWSVQSI